MTGTSNSQLVAILNVFGRFLYKVLLAVAIVWAIGLVVSLFVGDGPGGGAQVIVP